MIINVEYSI